MSNDAWKKRMETIKTPGRAKRKTPERGQYVVGQAGRQNFKP